MFIKKEDPLFEADLLVVDSFACSLSRIRMESQGDSFATAITDEDAIVSKIIRPLDNATTRALKSSHRLEAAHRFTATPEKRIARNESKRTGQWSDGSIVDQLPVIINTITFDMDFFSMGTSIDTHYSTLH